VGLAGDVMFEQHAGFGAPVESPFELALFRLEASVDSGGVDREQLLLRFGRTSRALAGPSEP
jgi:hypothetical protein